MNQSKTGKETLLERDDVLFILIDIQERLLPAMTNGERVIENSKRLLAFAKIARLPVILTEQEKLGSTLSAVKNEMPELEAVSKVHFNCFYADVFSHRVQQSGKRTLVLAGVESHICVAQTALHAVNDFHVHVVADATSSRTLDNWTLAIARMRDKGVTITSTEMVIYELLQRAGTDEFKAALQLVK